MNDLTCSHLHTTRHISSVGLSLVLLRCDVHLPYISSVASLSVSSIH
nr:MAG TPA: hypothetical protein [Caudoviricetes sp.]